MLPETVQTEVVFEIKLTGNPELAVVADSEWNCVGRLVAQRPERDSLRGTAGAQPKQHGHIVIRAVRRDKVHNAIAIDVPNRY